MDGNSAPSPAKRCPASASAGRTLLGVLPGPSGGNRKSPRRSARTPGCRIEIFLLTSACRPAHGSRRAIHRRARHADRGACHALCHDERRRMKLTRRDLLKLGIVTGGATLLPGRPLRLSHASSSDLGPSPPTTPFVLELLPGRGIPPLAKPVSRFSTRPDPTDCVNPDGTTAVHVSGPRVVPANTKFFLIKEKPVAHSFSPQLPPAVLWGYNGQIPGPTFAAKSGTPFLVRFVNNIPENDPVGIGEPITAVHRHGGFQAPEDDGYPLDTFCTGQSRDYFYPNVPEGGLQQNQHSTEWYHDHTIDITGPNVYRGLAGFFLHFNSFDTGNENDPPPALGLPSGKFDIGLVLQDKQFNQDGFLVFDDFDHTGFLGDKFLVNGLIQPFLKVARRKYRFRFLNGSNARFYELFMSNGQPFVAIATDDDLLEHPVTVQSFRIAPAERVEVVIDFSKFKIGDEVFIVNRLEQDDGRKEEQHENESDTQRDV